MMLLKLMRVRSGVWAGAAITLAVYGTLTALLAWLLDERHIVDIVLLYLLVCLGLAAIWGFRVGLLSAIVADLLVNLTPS